MRRASELPRTLRSPAPALITIFTTPAASTPALRSARNSQSSPRASAVVGPIPDATKPNKAIQFPARMVLLLYAEGVLETVVEAFRFTLGARESTKHQIRSRRRATCHPFRRIYRACPPQGGRC